MKDINDQSYLNELKQNLPPKDLYEFMYHTFYSVDDKSVENLKEYKKTWQPWDEWDYPSEDVVRFNKVIVNNLHHIKNKNVLDLPGHLGYFSYFSLWHGAKHVSIREVFQFKLNIAEAALSEYENYDLDISNICDLDKLKKDTDGIDTILFLGIAYHIHNHVDVFKVFDNSTAKTIIVDSTIPHSIKSVKHLPMIYYKYEVSANEQAECTNGADNPLFQSDIFVGAPTPAFIENLLVGMGWTKESYDEYTMNADSGDPTCRFVAVYTRE